MFRSPLRRWEKVICSSVPQAFQTTGLPPPKSCLVPWSLLYNLPVGQSPWPSPRLSDKHLWSK